MRKSIYFIITFILLQLCFSQTTGSIRVVADRDSVVTGENINFILDIKYPEKAKLDESIFDNEKIGDFEKVEVSDIDKKIDSGFRVERKKLVYSNFEESGDYYFGPVEIKYVLDEKEYVLRSDSIKISLISALSMGSVTVTDSTGTTKEIPLDSLQMVLPVKDIEEYKLTASEKLTIMWIVIIVIVTFLVVWLIMRRKRTKIGIVKEKVIIKDPAHVIAFRRIDELKGKNYLRSGDFKEFSTEISQITREYLENRYSFNALEIPTSEIISEIKMLVNSEALLSDLENLLTITDFVKFAKYTPLSSELEPFFTKLEELVEKTKEVESNKKAENV